MDIALHGLKDAAVALAIGIGAVAVAEASINELGTYWLDLNGSEVTLTRVRVIENWIAAAYEIVHYTVGFEALLVLILLLILAQMFLPALAFVMPAVHVRQRLQKVNTPPPKKAVASSYG